MAGVGAHRRERFSPKLDRPWRPRQVHTRRSSTSFQPRHLYVGRCTRPPRVPRFGAPTFRSLRSVGTLTLPAQRFPGVSSAQARPQPMAPYHRPSRAQPLMSRVHDHMRGLGTPTPRHVSPVRLFRLPRPHKRVLHPWHLGRRPRLLHGHLPRLPVAPRLPPDGLVGLGMLFLQSGSGLHKLHSPPSAAYAIDHSYQRTSFEAFSTKRPVARYTTPPLHGRLSIPRGLLQRCVAPPATH
jgi:hypothetical protein